MHNCMWHLSSSHIKISIIIC